MKQREDTLCCGDSVPPVGNTDGINLGVEEQVFGEPKPQNTARIGASYLFNLLGASGDGVIVCGRWGISTL
ncbi:hypothetical protein D8B26_003563 [Coccidioides posadasii str. Silveira]|uniref:uncharacterized protein n=1 Tax=Coccidioides posadasii (strain RMSCC 757 / Silveira) TaxID=443226 RepID=UPI001BF10954|nr:hypothetical protein D8B26_003563 [Coccidioides posadasii str. Silveira]